MAKQTASYAYLMPKLGGKVFRAGAKTADEGALRSPELTKKRLRGL